MRIFGFILFTLATALNAEVNTANISLTPPTTRENGAALKPGDIKHYLINITKPDNTKMELTMTDTKMTWTPPVVGKYSLTAIAVDQKGLKSKPSNIVVYTATEAESPPSRVLISLPIEGAPTYADVNGTIKVPAIGYFNLDPGNFNQYWDPIVIDNLPGMKAPDGAKSDDYIINPRVDYLVYSEGGEFTISFNGYAVDGLTDSLWVGLNNAKIPGFNGDKAIFAPTRGVWAYTIPVPITLPAGQQIINVYMRDKSYAINEILLTKVK